MTYDVAILSVIVFIASMVCLEKNHVPKIVKTVSMLKLVPFLFTCHLSWYGIDYFDTLALFCACRDNHECLSDFLALS